MQWAGKVKDLLSLFTQSTPNKQLADRLKRVEWTRKSTKTVLAHTRQKMLAWLMIERGEDESKTKQKEEK